MIGIDLGSNTIRLCQMDQNLKINAKFEKIVGSAKGLTEYGLCTFAMDRISLAIEEIVSKFDLSLGRFCATEAFRIAKNSNDFFDEIFNKFGVKFEIISPQEEARLTQKGVLNRLNLLNIKAQNPIIIDLGGASTEIMNLNKSRSFGLGIVRSFEKFGNNKAKLIELCKNANEFLNELEFDKIILTSGVPTTMMSIKFGMNYQNYDLDKVNGGILKFDDFDFVAKFLSKLSTKDGEILVGKGRLELIICGIYLLSGILENHKKSDFIVIDDGLREGICVDYFENLRRKNEY